jgi:ABC-type phosphate transport system substrate-binding protein
MKNFEHHLLFLIVIFIGSATVLAQNPSPVSPAATDGQSNKQTKIVLITGTRFTYPLIQKWIDDYSKVNPLVQVIIEPRGTTDPSRYDIMVEVYEQDEEIKKNREYLYVARYAILPVANSKSEFARFYQEKGINQDLISQLFFHDLYSDKKKEQEIKAPYTIYTRLQKAGAPIFFTKYFGYEQKDIRGKAIAGSDEHLLKAILRDSTGVSYLPLTLIYDHASRKPVPGLTVLPVDLNGNGRVSTDEKFYDDLTGVLARLEGADSRDIHTLPVGYVHFSVNKLNASAEAVEFLKWVMANGQNDLHDFGYLNPGASGSENQKFEQFASKRTRQ